MIIRDVAPNGVSRPRDLGAEVKKALAGLTCFSESLLERAVEVDRTLPAKEFVRRVWQIIDEATNELSRLRKMGTIGEQEASEASLAFSAYCAQQEADRDLRRLIEISDGFPELGQNEFFLGVLPSSEFMACVWDYANRQYAIQLNTGMLAGLINVNLLWWDLLKRRPACDPKLYIRGLCEALAAGDARPARYETSARSNLEGAGLIDMLMRTYVIAHELGHVVIHRRNRRFRNSKKEELMADEIGWYIYFGAALMLQPPFDKLYRDGKVRNNSERRSWMAQAQVKLGDNDLVRLVDPVTRFHAALDLDEAAALNHAIVAHHMYSAPFLVFRLFECLEYAIGRTRKRLPDTHPPARERAAKLLACFPPEIQAVVREKALPPIDDMFPAVPWRTRR
jgi:hypothetical protein